MSEERYVTLSEVKELLEEAATARELTPDQKASLDHAEKFARLTLEQAQKLQAELGKLGFVPDALCAKIADILPTHPIDVRAIFQKERKALEKNQIEQILSTVQKYL